MASATAYVRGGRYFVHSNSQTISGFWILSKPCHSLACDCTDEELGNAALTSLNASKSQVPDPHRDALILGPLLDLANAKSWRNFAKGARCVNLSSSEGAIAFTPTQGDSRSAFSHLNDLATRTGASDASTIGRELRAAFERAQ